MRNWNTSQQLSTSRIIKSFEPTYEELKLAYVESNNNQFAGFEPTYEELKPQPFSEPQIEQNQFWAYLWGIETSPKTYVFIKLLPFWAYLWGIETLVSHTKRLKQMGFEPTYEELKLYQTGSDKQKQILFWAYLWGIETLLYPPLSSFPKWFWAYLWGIETRPSFFVIAVILICFEPTYEELKHFFTLRFHLFPNGFEPTYEELKHARPSLL